MCHACQHKNNPEIRSIKWVGYEAATHVVVGFTCNSGGILATATDQLTAYRYARLYRQHGWTGVKVMPESEHTHKQVNQQMYEFIDT